MNLEGIFVPVCCRGEQFTAAFEAHPKPPTWHYTDRLHAASVSQFLCAHTTTCALVSYHKSKMRRGSNISFQISGNLFQAKRSEKNSTVPTQELQHDCETEKKKTTMVYFWSLCRQFIGEMLSFILFCGFTLQRIVFGNQIQPKIAISKCGALHFFFFPCVIQLKI